MSGNSLQVGRLSGIPLRLHISWFLVLILVTSSLAGAYFPQRYPGWRMDLHWLVGIVTALLLFTSIVVHELAHCLVARRHGVAVHDIVLFALGGVSELAEEPRTAEAELAMAIAGPLTSVGFGAGVAALWLLTWRTSEPLAAVLGYVGGINLALGIFNLIPGFPLDGGRVLRALLWRRSRSLVWATRWASRVGRVVAFGFIAAGAYEAYVHSLFGGLWMAFIGWFLSAAARSSYQEVVKQSLLARHTVGEIVSGACAAASPDHTLQDIVDQGLLAGGGLPLMEDGALLGLLTAQALEAFPHEEWPERTAREAMIPREQLRLTAPTEGLAVAVDGMSAGGAHPLPVMDNGRLVGLLTQERVAAFVKLKIQLGGG